MSEPEQFGSGEEDPAAAKFYSGALGRIRRFMLGLGASGTVGVWAWYGWRMGLGFLAGAIVAWANFLWLERIVEALGRRATKEAAGQNRESGGGVVARFLLRYALIALGAYVIFRGSPASLYGFLGGLFLAVGAILCEAGYEVYGALRRGF